MKQIDNTGLEQQLLMSIWKNKIMILVVTLIGAVIAALASTSYITPYYEVRMVIEPSMVRIFISEEEQERITIENSISLAEKIRDGVYDQQLKRVLKLPLLTEFNFRAVTSKGTHKIGITLLWPDPEEGKKILAQLMAQIEGDLEHIVQQIAQKYAAGLNSYNAKISAIIIQQKAIQSNVLELRREYKVLGAMRFEFEKHITSKKIAGNGGDNDNLFLLYTLSSQDLLSSRANIVTEIAELEKSYIENELVKADSQRFHDMIASENDLLKPLRLSGGIESGIKPVTISQALIIVSGAVMGLLLALIFVVVRRDQL